MLATGNTGEKKAFDKEILSLKYGKNTICINVQLPNNKNISISLKGCLNSMFKAQLCNYSKIKGHHKQNDEQ